MPSRTESERWDSGAPRVVGEALLFLRDTQIRDRGACRDPLHDYTGPDGARAWRLMTRETFDGRPIWGDPFGQTRNREGEWPCFVNIMPEILGRGMPRSLVRYHDSNAFTPASIIYPMFLVDESALPPERRLTEPMVAAGVNNLLGFRRNGGFAFWPSIEPASSDAECVGPLNIPHAGNGMKLMKLMPDKAFKTASALWYREGFDPAVNPYGNDAFSNLPCDADDTSLIICLLHMSEALHDRPLSDVTPAGFAETLLSWRDLGRSQHDYRNEWLPSDSGAFLTWLKDEALPTFADPHTGVIPSGINNVDPVVNANVLCALGMLGMTSAPGIHEAVAVIGTALADHTWEDRTIYYPQRMMLPYAFTRACRDGDYHDPQTQGVLGDLCRRLLAIQGTDGAFAGGPDTTRDLSTALGLCSLLNIGADAADDAGVQSAYELGVAAAVDFLLGRYRSRPPRHPDELRPIVDGAATSVGSWEAGTHYAASRWSIGQWRSEALTTAIATEALLRWLLCYDLDRDASIHTRRLKVLGYGSRGPIAASPGGRHASA